MTTKVLIPRVQKDSSSSECSSSEVSIRTASTPGRKRKLDHLSVEEKIQRKKLKNRVAAQTSRDRKKKQMEEMVVTIEKYEKEVLHWKTKFNQLQTKYEKLEKENRKLKANQSNHKDINNNIVKREIVAHSIPEEHKYTRSFVEDTKIDDRCVDSVVIKSEGPAASSEPLQKVMKMKTESTQKSSKKYSQNQVNDVKALLKVVLLCLLYKNSSKTSTCNSTLKNLQKVLSLSSTPTSKQILQWAIAQMPKKRANNSSCLDQWWTSKCLGPQNQEWNPPKIAIGAQ